MILNLINFLLDVYEVRLLSTSTNKYFSVITKHAVTKNDYLQVEPLSSLFTKQYQW